MLSPSSSPSPCFSTMIVWNGSAALFYVCLLMLVGLSFWLSMGGCVGLIAWQKLYACQHALCTECCAAFSGDQITTVFITLRIQRQMLTNSFWETCGDLREIHQPKIIASRIASKMHEPKNTCLLETFRPCPMPQVCDQRRLRMSAACCQVCIQVVAPSQNMCAAVCVSHWHAR